LTTTKKDDWEIESRGERTPKGGRLSQESVKVACIDRRKIVGVDVSPLTKKKNGKQTRPKQKKKKEASDGREKNTVGQSIR